MILVFDTETTTFPSANLAPSHPAQARIVQLAWVLLDDTFKERSCFNSLIRIPSSVRIAEGARKAHGITEEDCEKYGAPVNDTLAIFLDRFANSSTFVAHNIKFDMQLVNIEHELLYGPLGYGPKDQFCTMEAMTPICQLPFANGKRSYGNQKYKWPTLQEAHQHAFGQRFEGAHDALADVRATARIYKWLKEKELCQTQITSTT